MCVVEGVKLRGFVGMGFRRGFPAWVCGGSVTVGLWVWFFDYDLWLWWL